MDDGLKAAAASLREYVPRYEDSAVAFSGGKDSTALATVAEYLFADGEVPRPNTCTLCK